MAEEPFARDPYLPKFANSNLSVVGLGGSAGSIEALEAFFEQTPAKSGMVYVVIVHLSPEHESSLGEILQRSTPMPVLQVTGNVRVEPDHVYVISPGRHLTMVDDDLSLTEVPQPRGRSVAVDLFFQTLADSHGPKATAIVLSGGDGDGAMGLKRIKERGGLTIAQDPDEAIQDGMPRAAISTGMVDWVLPVEEMPKRLLAYRENAERLTLPPEEQPPPRESRTTGQQDEEALLEVLAFLCMRTGHDFSYYKRATILRRIGRRMQVNGCETLPDYRSYLRTHPGETGALLQNLLINVTNFFREKEAFTALEAMIPDLFKDKGPGDQVRVWIAACATGEEAYSVAMLLCEHAARMDAPPQIQVFATDIDESAIEAARDGAYPETIAADVSEERLRRFFTKESGRYRVRRSLREVVLFALHDLLKGSPFSRLDLVTCRNLLIYLNREAQGRVFGIFHFALRSDGKLFLGSSESAEEAASLFSPSDKKNRIYFRRSVHRVGVVVPSGAPTLAHTLPKRWLSAIVESSKDAIITFTLAGDIISWNQGAENLFGYTAAEITGKSKSLLVPPELVTQSTAILERLKAGEQINTFETVHVRKDGTPIDVSVTVSAMRSDDGEFVGATAITQDITARKQAEEELGQARDQLKERVEQRTTELRNQADQLRRLATELTRSEQRERNRMASLLHDHLQQLLVSAKLRLEGMRRQLTDGQKEEIAAVVDLLNETLDSSRSLAVELSPPILNEGLAPALEWLGGVWMKEKYDLNVNLDLERRIDTSNNEIRGIVFLAVRELLFNVVKHSGVSEARLELAAKDGSTLRVTVKDGGRGFDPAALGGQSTGSGLGLLTVRERIGMLGGTLELRSAEGEGVETVITAPRGADMVRRNKEEDEL